MVAIRKDNPYPDSLVFFRWPRACVTISRNSQHAHGSHDMTRISLVLLLALSVFRAGAAAIVPSPPQISAKAYLLVDATSGAVLAEENADMPLPPASLTKAQKEALRCIAEGDRHAAAAAKLGITESAFKARLISVRERLKARTTAEALQRAKEYRLL